MPTEAQKAAWHGGSVGICWALGARRSGRWEADRKHVVRWDKEQPESVYRLHEFTSTPACSGTVRMFSRVALPWHAWAWVYEQERREDKAVRGTDFTPAKCNLEALTHSWLQQQSGYITVFTPSGWNRWSGEIKLTTRQDPLTGVHSTVLRCYFWRLSAKAFALSFDLWDGHVVIIWSVSELLNL